MVPSGQHLLKLDGKMVVTVPKEMEVKGTAVGFETTNPWSNGFKSWVGNLVHVQMCHQSDVNESQTVTRPTVSSRTQHLGNLQ